MNVKIKILFLLIVLSLYYSKNNQAQKFENVKFDRLTSENIKIEKGLSQNWIHAILQDKYGYMWFGTWEGLNKYDGYSFTVYNIENGLSDHIIYSLLEDNDGTLWIGTENGLNKFARKNQKFISYSNLPGDTSMLYHNRVLHLIQTKDGLIWLGTGRGLYSFNTETEIFTPYIYSGQEYFSPRSDYMLHLFEDNNGNFWISTTYGLIIFDPETKRSTRYYHIEGDPSSISHNNVRHVLQEKSGNFWIGTRYGLNYYDTVSQEMNHYFHDPNDQFSLSDNFARVIYQDSKDDIWIGTESGGINLYDRENDRFIRYQNELNNINSLGNNKVYSINEDKSGNLWVGTFKGLSKINKYHNDFKHCQRTSNENTSLNSNGIWSFFEDENKNLWIGTDNGINFLNRQNSKFSYLRHDPTNPNSLSGNDVRSIIYDQTNNCIWFLIYGISLDCYDLAANKITHFVKDPNRNSISDDYVNDIFLGSNGLIWIATSRGLDVLNPATNIIEHFYHSSADTNSISDDLILCISEDNENNLWIGTDYGLNKFINSEKRFIRYLNNPENKNSLSNNTVFYIYPDKAGNVWIGTSGGGLNKLSPQTGEFKIFTTIQGLPNNIIYGIHEDEDGNLWISTNYGLSKFYTISERFVNYNVMDGIQSNEFNLGACYKDKDGKLYFGGINGYNVFDPKEIKYNPNKPVIVVSSFRKFNEVIQEEFYDGDTIRLNYDDNFFSIEISALDYTNPAKNRYRYMLENVDKDWIQTDADNRRAEYKKVRPGSYTFKATGSNNDGIWNDEGITLNIIISPPWWDTWYSKIIAGLIIIALFLLIIYWRVRRVRKQHLVDKKMLKIEKQMFDLEQKALRLQMNPHFIFNSLNSIQSYILSNSTEKAIIYLGKFSQLMRLTLSNSVHKYIPFKNELKAIRHYLDLEKLRFESKFDYNISIDENIDEDFIKIPPMIVQPYIENAIIHGLLHKPTKGHIDIDFRINKNQITSTVQDNGVGRKKAMEIEKSSGIRKISRGMLITKARLEILNRQSRDEYSVRIIDLKDDKNNAIGTKVVLKIQFKDNII